jgi:hypothetical protein
MESLLDNVIKSIEKTSLIALLRHLKRRLSYSRLTSLRASVARDSTPPDSLDKSMWGISTGFCWDTESLLKGVIKPTKKRLAKVVMKRRIAYSCLTSLRASEARETIAPDNLDQSTSGSCTFCWGMESFLRNMYQADQQKNVINRRITYNCLTSFRASEAREKIAPFNLDQSGWSGMAVTVCVKGQGHCQLWYLRTPTSVYATGTSILRTRRLQVVVRVDRRQGIHQAPTKSAPNSSMSLHIILTKSKSHSVHAHCRGQHIQFEIFICSSQSWTWAHW